MCSFQRTFQLCSASSRFQPQPALQIRCIGSRPALWERIAMRPPPRGDCRAKSWCVTYLTSENGAFFLRKSLKLSIIASMGSFSKNLRHLAEPVRVSLNGFDWVRFLRGRGDIREPPGRAAPRLIDTGRSLGRTGLERGAMATDSGNPRSFLCLCQGRFGVEACRLEMNSKKSRSGVMD